MVLIAVAAVLSAAFAFILDQPHYRFLHHAKDDFLIDCSAGPCIASHAYVVDADYQDVVEAATHELIDYAVKSGSTHTGEYIFSREGGEIHISFWYKRHGETARADEPPDVSISRQATWSDEIRGWWDDLTSR